jgi:hypothetical protein
VRSRRPKSRRLNQRPAQRESSRPPGSVKHRAATEAGAGRQTASHPVFANSETSSDTSAGSTDAPVWVAVRVRTSRRRRARGRSIKGEAARGPPARAESDWIQRGRAHAPTASQTRSWQQSLRADLPGPSAPPSPSSPRSLSGASSAARKPTVRGRVEPRRGRLTARPHGPRRDRCAVRCRGAAVRGRLPGGCATRVCGPANRREPSRVHQLGGSRQETCSPVRCAARSP